MLVKQARIGMCGSNKIWALKQLIVKSPVQLVHHLIWLASEHTAQADDTCF